MSDSGHERFKMRNVVPGWDWFEYVQLRVLAAVINFLPIAVSSWIAARIGDLLLGMWISPLAIPFRRQERRKS